MSTDTTSRSSSVIAITSVLDLLDLMLPTVVDRLGPRPDRDQASRTASASGSTPSSTTSPTDHRPPTGPSAVTTPIPSTSTRTSDRPRRDETPRTVPLATPVRPTTNAPSASARVAADGGDVQGVAQGCRGGAVQRDEGLVAEERRDLAGGGPDPEVGGCVDLQEPAGGHDGDAVGDGEGLVLVVGDEHGGGAGGDERGAQVDGEAFAQGAVEGGQGLVEQQEPGCRGERAGQGDALPLAAGQGRDAAVLVAGQPDELEQLRDARARSGRAGRRRRSRRRSGARRAARPGTSARTRAGARARRPARRRPTRRCRRPAVRGPATARSSDDLPQPDGPSSATTEPGATSRETPSTAGRRAVPDDDVPQRQTVHHSPPAPGARSRSQAATIPAVSTARTTDAASAMP